MLMKPSHPDVTILWLRAAIPVTRPLCANTFFDLNIVYKSSIENNYQRKVIDSGSDKYIYKKSETKRLMYNKNNSFKECETRKLTLFLI